MKKTSLLSSAAALLCLAAQAQILQPVLPPGKIAVFKAGVSGTAYPINSSKVQPCFVEAFDTVLTNQAAPLVTIPLSTNSAVPGSVWINAHAGSEGGGISRSVNREFLALEGYTGTILSPTAAKPSAAVGVDRGIVTLDAFTNAISVYSDPADWFGLESGVTQNNPTGIASTDGTNFWGTGNVTGTGAEASGVLYYNDEVSPDPLQIENYIQAAAEARIIGGTLYVVVPGAGIYNFLNNNPPYQVVPLPADPVSNPYQSQVATNMFLPFGLYTTSKLVSNFDMNPQGTIAYGADETYGIVKFTNANGTANPVWVQAPYYFSTTNIGTILSPASEQGCFGICVDFSGTNPVIYATTMENGTTPPGNSQGNPNQNRLIEIVDSGNPGTNLVAETLATAPSINESFRGIDFTPDLSPLITSQPANDSSTVHGNGTFSLTVSSVYALNYQWLQATATTTNYLSNQTNAALTISNLDINMNGYDYQCVVSNVYGAVTSTPAILTVTTTATLPSIPNAVVYITNYIGNSITLGPIVPNGTQPFTYQWYQNGYPLSDNDESDDGATYVGSTNNVLVIASLGTDETGNYSLAVTNDAGGIIQQVVVVTVQYQPPTITIGGEPQSATTFAGLPATFTVTPSGGTYPLNYQWYFNNVPLTDGNEYSGSQTATLTINPVGFADAGSYTVMVGNQGGGATSQPAILTVLATPPHSAVAYSNQVYLQTFDSLPDPGSNSVNSFNNPTYSGKLDGVAYSLGNPFDFAYPIVINVGLVGGLGLSNTMSGWYGAADTLYTGVGGETRFGAQDGDQTTGGVIDFGPNDGEEGPGILGSNRALGLLSTGTTGSTTFALKLVNTSGSNLNYVDVSFLGELWHNGTSARTMTFGYTLDNTATSFDLTAESISNAVVVPDLTFSWPIAAAVTTVDGTQPANQTNLVVTNLALATPWQPNAALWLIWSINYYGTGSGNGYAIDNLNFSASGAPLAPVTAPILGGVTYNASTGLSFSFTDTPGASSQFTVYGTTNLALPFSQWQNLGHPTEISSGTYKVTDSQSATNSQKFYKVTSP
jgi:hypothetical protein